MTPLDSCFAIHFATSPPAPHRRTVVSVALSGSRIFIADPFADAFISSKKSNPRKVRAAKGHGPTLCDIKQDEWICAKM